MSKRLPSSGGWPTADNAERNLRRAVTRDARQKVRIWKNGGGRIPRKRKKYVHRVERGNYAALLVELIRHNYLAHKKDEAKE